MRGAWERRGERGLPENAERNPRGTDTRRSRPRRSVSHFIFYSSVVLCFETKAQLMDSWRSEDLLPGATLMYCCPISAFNWCPQGQAGPELGHSLLSPLLHTAKVKFITYCSNPLGERAREGGREGRKRYSSVLRAQSLQARRSWIRLQITRFLQFPDSSRAWREGSGPWVAEDYEFARRKGRGARIVCRSPPHVVSWLVNNGCLLTRMRRLNNLGWKIKHASSRRWEPSRTETCAGAAWLGGTWRKVGTNRLQGAQQQRKKEGLGSVFGVFPALSQHDPTPDDVEETLHIRAQSNEVWMSHPARRVCWRSEVETWV